MRRRAPPRGGGRAGLEPGAVGLALDDEVVGAAGEAIEGALRADGIGEGGEPFIGPAVAGDDQRAGAVAFEEDLIGVAALLGLHGVEGEVVDDEEVDGEELAELGLVTLGEAGVLEGLEQRVRAEGEDGVAAATGDVAQGVGEKALADADGPDEGDVVMRLQEAERDELVEERAIEGDVGRGVPVLELGARVEAGPLRPQGGGQAVPARHLVGEDEQEELLVGQRLLAHEGEALGERVEDAREPEAPQHGLQIGRDGHRGSCGISFVRPRAQRGAAGRSGWRAADTGRAAGRAPGAAARAAAARARSRARRWTLSISAASAVCTRGVDAGVAIAAHQAEQGVGLAHPGPGQVPGQQGAGELADGRAVALGPAGQALDVAQGVDRLVDGEIGAIEGALAGRDAGVDLDADRAGVEADGGGVGAGPQGVADILGRQRVQPARHLGMLIPPDLGVAPERDVVGRGGGRAQRRLLDGLEVLARGAQRATVAPPAIVLAAPLHGMRPRLGEIAQHLPGEAVVADGGHGALHARLVPRRRTRVGSMTKPRAWAYSRKVGVSRGSRGSARWTIVFVLSGIRTRKTPWKNAQAASQASIAVSVVSRNTG